MICSFCLLVFVCIVGEILCVENIMIVFGGGGLGILLRFLMNIVFWFCNLVIIIVLCMICLCIYIGFLVMLSICLIVLIVCFILV